MTIKEVLFSTTQKIKTAQIINPQLEANLIVSLVTKLSAEKLILKANIKISLLQEKKIKELIKKRIAGWPWAYLSGKKSFYNLDFVVNKNTLIPRPESELIIDEIIKNEINNKTIIIDIGTGSGCLIISLADILRNKKNINFYAIDISAPTLQVAKKNAKIHKLEKNIKFLKGDLLKPLINKIPTEKLNIIIIANLPYLTKEEIKGSPSLKMEPKTALYGGKDGLNYYREMWDQIKLIKNNNNSIRVYQEISDWQKEKLEEIITKKISPLELKNKTITDLAGHRRLIITTIN